jgi:superfamily I DNA and/or RNA helicase/very-short-patch-repair endonuclease
MLEDGQNFSQIKFDKNFIKRLLDKLKIGNARSIHLNVLPGRSATRLDLFTLSNINDTIPSNFIENIINKESFSFEISYDNLDLSNLEEDKKRELVLISKRLNTIVVENIDHNLEFGIKSFGFGYPILVKRDRNDPTKIIKAPLFIWNLDIIRSYQNKNTWTIKKEEDFTIKINEILVSHLIKDEAIKIDNIPKEVLEDGFINGKELITLIQNILNQLNSDKIDLNLKIEKCPESKQIEAIANSKPYIQWSGILGLYKSQKETIINSTEEILERFDEFENEDLILEKFQTSSISSVETDPSKEEIINTLTKSEIKLIQGPPGTGKSQSITAILSNALANNAICLVVCEKKTALDVIFENLTKIKPYNNSKESLADFAIVIDDVNNDRKKTIQKARDIKESLHYSRFSQLEFDEKYKKFCYLKQEINLKNAEAIKKVFGDFSWKQLIGLYLRYSRSGDIVQFEKKLNFQDLEFNYEEYSKFYSIVEEASFLYSDVISNSDEIFKIINNTIFSSDYKWGIHNSIKTEVAKFSYILYDINVFLSDKKESDYEINKVSIFSPELLNESIYLIENIINNLKEVTYLYEKLHILDRTKYDNINFLQNLKYNFTSIFNNQSKDVKDIRANILNLTNILYKDIELFSKFEMESLHIKKIKEYSKLSEIKNDCNNNLETAKKIQNYLIQLVETQKNIKSLESKLSEIEETKIFNFKVTSFVDFYSFDKLKSFYIDLESEIKNLSNNLESYESYHKWKYFCSNRSELELQILYTLEDFNTRYWKEIFMAWYYRGAILNFDSNTKNGFNKSSIKLKQLSNLYKELEEEQIHQIKSLWYTNRIKKIEDIDFNFNTLYNLRKNNSGPKNSLRKIIEKDFNLFTSLFPIILTNPSTVNAIFPLKQGLFNIVIFDEASQLRIEDTFTSLIRGQYKIIAGDEHQMPPSSYFQSNSYLKIDDELDDDDNNEDYNQSILAESESLLDYATNYDDKIINKSYLDFHYRSKHPALIEFSNSAFYGGNLISFPEQEVYTPIEFKAVNGIYESSTNPEEVNEILKIIANEIHVDRNGKYPSIGIATFNIYQKYLITNALDKLAEENISFSNKLHQLKERGLFIKNLENIQGDEKDIIIISTTYGIQRNGRFIENFSRLNRIEGYKLLNVLITRAKYKVYVCTSIPKEKYLSYQDLIKNEGNNKRGILYAYLAYAEAVSNNDIDFAENILTILKEQSFEKTRIISNSEGLSESPFEEEVYHLLVEEFGKENIIQQHKIGGFRLDFIIKTKNHDVVLECDGKAYHSSEEAYAYDMYRQKELENMGFVVYRIWSTNWFQDQNNEMLKLKRFLEELD